MDQEEISEEETKRLPINRSEGVTSSERYLNRLGERSFLTLWSYPGVFRDQGHTKKGGDGKEIGDLLVVFEEHILIFSDKYCEFKDTGNLKLDWSRWYRAAILGGAKQVWGAERWIRQHPDRLFLDKGCTQPFPFPLPSPDVAKFHRIIVAHGASERCKKELGGSGSLLIATNKFGPIGTGIGEGTQPFMVGQIDPSKGFVHIFDDTSLDIVMETLDTTSDFVNYLTKKELFISSPRFISAVGEEELLAIYATKMNLQGEHDFVFPGDPNAFITVSTGHWDDFVRSPERKRQKAANEVSYAWDKLIEKFNGNVLGDTLYFESHNELSAHEQNLRWLARENRTRRRLLIEALFGLIAKTPSNQRGTRVVAPSNVGEPYFVFHISPPPSNTTYEKYRELRRLTLEDYCKVVKLKCPDAQHIVGLALESGVPDEISEDLIYLDVTDWTPERQEEAEQIQQERGFLKKTNQFESVVNEFPKANHPNGSRKHSISKNTPYRNQVKIGRNDPCHCGSGKKYKYCHGA
jgi:hypothetical protein